MSYNITSINILSIDARISVDDIRWLYGMLGGWPEANFVSDTHRKLQRGAITASASGEVALETFEWHGEGSGNAFHDHMADVASSIRGHVEAVVIWEGGDRITGLRIRDRVMTQPAVRMALEGG